MNDSIPDFAHDPRLTAYALGELDDAELAEFEALVAGRPAAAGAIEEIRRLAGDLEETLLGESIAPLPAAAIVPLEAGRSSWPRRIQSCLYVASAIAAAWAAALIIFRSALHRAPGVIEGAGLIRTEKNATGTDAPAPSPGAAPNAPSAQPPTFSFAAAAPLQFRFAAPLPRMRTPASQTVLDAGQLSADLRNFEVVQPALGAGAREPLGQDLGQVVLRFSTGHYRDYRHAGIFYGLGDLSRGLDTSPDGMGGFKRPLSIPARPSPSEMANAIQSGMDAHGTIPGPDMSLFDSQRARSAAAGAVANSWAPDPLRVYQDRLRELTVIDGTEVGHAELPGRFSQLFQEFLFHGDRAAYERMMSDPNAEVSAMGALCLASQCPGERARVFARMGSDLRPITYVRAGGAPQPSTLGALFRLIALDPDYLFSPGSASAPPRP
ncbi:MAG TPA: hypothetical protein VHC86_11110 [Opitutaceae bacterium]|nr:hypothetical protein [Opitutaceae bacterium]